MFEEHLKNLKKVVYFETNCPFLFKRHRFNTRRFFAKSALPTNCPFLFKWSLGACLWTWSWTGLSKRSNGSSIAYSCILSCLVFQESSAPSRANQIGTGSRQGSATADMWRQKSRWRPLKNTSDTRVQSCRQCEDTRWTCRTLLVSQLPNCSRAWKGHDTF